MKKLIALLAIVILSSCAVVQSPYKNEMTYWGSKVALVGLQISQQGVLSYNATKAGKVDSALIYGTTLISLTYLLIDYKDSLIYYTNKK